MKIKYMIPFLAAVLLMAGCGNKESDPPGGPTPPQETEETSGAEESPGATPGTEESPEAPTGAEDDPDDSLKGPDTEGGIEDKVQQEEQEEVAKMNGIEIMKECPAEVYGVRENMSYGIVTHQTYHSETTGLDRGVNILLPGDYDETREYPVLYLLHGIFGDEYSLSGDVNIRLVEIAGNLAADGLAKEMIIVLPNMYASSDPDQAPGFNNESIAPYDNFINDLVNDLIPFIEKNYLVLPGRENRAIAGFSMGGRETLFIGLSRPDLFGYVGAIAPAPGLTPGKDWAMTHPGQLKEEELTFAGKDYEPDVLMICCGTRDSVVGKFPQSYHNIFENNGVEHIWYEVPGADHDAEAIKSGLNNFLRAIFRN